jgi:hypothetical protein
MIRQTLLRCQPGFKKEVGTGDSQARIFVGTLQEAQWNEYKKLKASFLPSWTSRTSLHGPKSDQERLSRFHA